ncbi:MAG: bifunctional phosphoribosylaminoimidazolecarboxamide formyltransferase/IMP cyclohydrolase [Nitrospirota bacterium]
MGKIRRALISVSDKREISSFARRLADFNVEIISTGGTARTLIESGLTITEISDFTGFPEMLDGRVKTLHPKVHGGLLGIRDNPEHRRQMNEYGIKPIDMVVVNLYPFEKTINKSDCTLEEAIENIDIGGPAMLRSAAKNFKEVVVITDPDDYQLVADEMERLDGDVSAETRYILAMKVFQHTSRYDSIISRYLESRVWSRESKFPQILTLQFEKEQDLRYGENPHQRAAFYREFNVKEPCVATARQLQGKELSFNNILDANSALELVKEFAETSAVIIKHNNPCGVARAERLVEAYRMAREVDPVSAFGGVIAFNHIVDAETAKEITSTFVEVVIAPGFTEESIEIFKSKKDIRLLDIGAEIKGESQGVDMKKVVGGLIYQDRDLGKIEDIKALRVVTRRTPTDSEYRAMELAWKVCKHVKSNAIVYSNPDVVVGIGAGQMSRVDSAKIGIMKARFPVKGTVIASDAFFPFRDSIDAASEAGVTAIIQPGGSLRDEEVIHAADEHGMAMVFTGMRHFRH